MIWTKIKRIFKAGFVSFWRNGYVSLSSVVVMIVTLFVISSIIFTSAMLSGVLVELKNKVDVNIYFVNEAREDQILDMKKQLEALPEVAVVEYMSREEALERFKQNNENNAVIMRSLEEVGENPLGAVLNIKAKEPSQYESIASYLTSEEDVSNETLIEKITYYQNKEAIDTLTSIIEAGRKLGVIVTIIFVVLSILITFNTIRLAIHMSRDEIAVMKLVGASNMFIRGPFIVSGIMYGVLAAIITLIILYPLTYWLGPVTEKLFGEVSLFAYYLSNFGQMFVIIVLSGAIIGAISSFLAVRRYLSR